MRASVFFSGAAMFLALAGCQPSGSGQPEQTGGITSSGGQEQSGGAGGGSGGATGSGGTTSTTSSGGTTDTGGTTSAGGTTSTGGTTGSGGQPGTGGATASGGVADSGGTTAPGGTTGRGGRTGTGGATATGGVTGTSGTGTAGVRTGGTSGRGGATGTGGAGTGGTTTTGTSTDACTVPPSPGGGTSHCSSSSMGKVGDFSWSIWSSGSGGCIITYGVGCAFKATWNNSGDFLARMGYQWDETKTFDQYGTITADFAETKSASGVPYSSIGIYGWSNNPLIEFYIVDDWFGGHPIAGSTKKGSFDVDGGTYDIRTSQRVNAPCIHGTTTFTQYFSVRKTARKRGHISVSEHFKKWAGLGMPLGKMYEAKILVEAGGGSGSLDFTSATMTMTTP
jgi:endo-1,4-beta-xylanase